MFYSIKFVIALIFTSIFNGYGILSILKVFFPRAEGNDRNPLFNDVDNTATAVVKFAGIAYLVFLLVNAFVGYQAYVADHGTKEEYVFISRLTGPYWYGYWLHLLFYPLASQLLWINKLKESKFARLILGVLFIISFEKIVIFITSLHWNYLPGGWDYSFSTFILNWVFHIGIFAMILGIVLIIKNTVKTLHNKEIK
jgi:hypothetical protein